MTPSLAAIRIQIIHNAVMSVLLRAASGVWHTGCSKSQGEDWEVRGLQLVLAIHRLQAICQQKRSSGNGEGESAPVHDGSLPTLECKKEVG